MQKGVLVYLLPLLLLGFPSLNAAEAPPRYRLLGAGSELSDSLKAYKSYREAANPHDHPFLTELATRYLERDLSSPNPKTRLSTLYALILANHPKNGIYALKFLHSPEPAFQSALLSMLYTLQDGSATPFLHQALSSNYFPIRYGALEYLVSRRSPEAIGQIQTLLFKLPKPFHLYGSELLATLGTPEAESLLCRLAVDDLPELRISTLQSLWRHKQHSFLPFFQSALQSANAKELEIASIAVGELSDLSSFKTLLRHQKHRDKHVALAASYGSFLLGYSEVVQTISEAALEKNLFAIAMLGFMEGGEKELWSLLHDQDRDVRLGATFSLLMRKDPRILPYVTELLTTPSNLLLYLPKSSPGGVLSAFCCYPASQTMAQEGYERQVDKLFRRQLLTFSLELGQEPFFTLVDTLIKARTQGLAGSIVSLVANLENDSAHQKLLRLADESGWPLLRLHARLSLYQKGDKSQKKGLIDYLKGQNKEPTLDFEARFAMVNDTPIPTELSPKEHAELFLAILQSLAFEGSDESIDLLLTLLEQAHPTHRSLLAGALYSALHG